ncbi:hypothetical protein B5F40_15375 [Gordonibacter sp. An230]|uniref:hypothetical protein n=1 Tax=Gordonibacter sp. An230 TaxID=1965592 RepID=UPI000B3A3782|nr:hypothetical protein [Gordonibacter sp. An230]OUO86089.1 hypothetical protein B5F40_15375 [Gordonibacter sp. An230]
MQEGCAAGRGRVPCACCGRCGGRDVRRAAGARRAVCVGVLRARVHAAPRRAAGAGVCRVSAWDVPLPCCVPQALGVLRAVGAAGACRAATCGWPRARVAWVLQAAGTRRAVCVGVRWPRAVGACRVVTSCDVRRAAGARRAARALRRGPSRKGCECAAGACRASAWDVPLPCCVPQALGVLRAVGAAGACRAATCGGPRAPGVPCAWACGGCGRVPRGRCGRVPCRDGLRRAAGVWRASVPCAWARGCCGCMPCRAGCGRVSRFGMGRAAPVLRAAGAAGACSVRRRAARRGSCECVPCHDVRWTGVSRARAYGAAWRGLCRDVRRAAGARRAVCVGVLRARVHAAPRRAAGAGACRASAWDVPLPCCVPQALRARAACAGVPRAAGAASACRATTCDGLACRVRGRTAPLGAGCARGQHVEGVADGGPFRFPRRARRGGVRLRGSFLWSSCRSGGCDADSAALGACDPEKGCPGAVDS